MVMRWVVTFVLLLGLAVPALAAPPIPPLTGRVLDLAGILDARTVEKLTKKLADHEAKTTDQIVVVTLPTLQGYTIEQWGLALLNGWGIGQHDKDNGVVLVIAPNDRQLRIEVGTGFEWQLANKQAGDIIQHEIIPRFKEGDLKGGVTDGVNAIIGTLNGTYDAPLLEARETKRIGFTREQFQRYIPFIGIPMLFVVIVGVILLVRHGPTSGSVDRGYAPDPRDEERDQARSWRQSLTRGLGTTAWGGSSRSSGFSSSRGGFSGGGGRGRGGGASGRW